MRVYDNEDLFDTYDVEVEFDEDSGEHYKVIPDTIDITGVQATIDSAITHLEALKGSLDCFNEKGLKIVENNINDVIDCIRYATIDLGKKE